MNHFSVLGNQQVNDEDRLLCTHVQQSVQIDLHGKNILTPSSICWMISEIHDVTTLTMII